MVEQANRAASRDTRRVACARYFSLISHGGGGGVSDAVSDMFEVADVSDLRR